MARLHPAPLALTCADSGVGRAAAERSAAPGTAGVGAVAGAHAEVDAIVSDTISPDTGSPDTSSPDTGFQATDPTWGGRNVVSRPWSPARSGREPRLHDRDHVPARAPAGDRPGPRVRSAEVRT